MSKINPQMTNLKSPGEKLFHSIFDNIPVACFGFDEKGRILALNNACRKLYGFSEKNVQGKSMFGRVIQRKDKDRTLEIIREVSKGESFMGLE